MPPLLHPALPSSGSDYRLVAMVVVWSLQCRIRMCARGVERAGGSLRVWHKTRAAAEATARLGRAKVVCRRHAE
jgi:hypothetical protein